MMRVIQLIFTAWHVISQFKGIVPNTAEMTLLRRLTGSGKSSHFNPPEGTRTLGLGRFFAARKFFARVQ
jgi:hypothetical protein